MLDLEFKEKLGLQAFLGDLKECLLKMFQLENRPFCKPERIFFQGWIQATNWVFSGSIL
jgi:hypothetical protein